MVDGLRPPDVAILMHGKRFSDSKEAGHIHEENDGLTERVQRLHLELAEEFGWHTVDANRPKEAVHADVLAAVTRSRVEA